MGYPQSTVILVPRLPLHAPIHLACPCDHVPFRVHLTATLIMPLYNKILWDLDKKSRICNFVDINQANKRCMMQPRITVVKWNFCIHRRRTFV